jgi:hypothetical protein
MPSTIPSRGAPPLVDVVAEMLGHLKSRLPDPGPAPVPAPAVAIVRLTERPVGLGNRRGNEGRGPAPLVALKGCRLEATARFHLWADDLGAVDGSVLALQQELLVDREELRAAGFLRLEAAGATSAERIADPAAWRRTADYDLLYEHRYADTEGAGGLIARVPVDLDGGTTVVTDRLVRWDQHGAPPLEVRRRGRGEITLRMLYAVAFLPSGFDGAPVTLESLSGGLPHRRDFTSLRELLDAFTAERGEIELDGNSYRTGRLTFADPVILRRGDELFRLSYGDQSFGAGSEAVVYLRTLG